MVDTNSDSNQIILDKIIKEVTRIATNHTYDFRDTEITLDEFKKYIEDVLLNYTLTSKENINKILSSIKVEEGNIFTLNFWEE